MKEVAILLSTYNGEKYLNEQIESILSQKKVEVHIYIRDDGSKDKTKELLRELEKKSNIDVFYGENIGVINSFFSLVKQVNDNYEYYAFCDQDDYWKNNKLFRAISKIQNERNAALYHSDAILVNQDLVSLNVKFKKEKEVAKDFPQSIVFSNCTGCTVVINRKLLKYLKQYTPAQVLMHDDWICKLCFGLGGIVYYDSSPTILYRQHSQNVIGGVKHGFWCTWKRRLKEVKENPNMRSIVIKEIYDNYLDVIPKKNLKYFNLIINYRKSLKNKFRLLMSKEIKGLSFEKQLMFKCAVILSKF